MSKDTIYREDAIKAVENVSENYTKEGDREWHPHIDFITQALVEVPSIPSANRPQGEWIPCSERLPQYRDVVLVSTFWGVRVAERDGIKEDGTDDFWYLFLNDATAHPRYVYAWMPLPEPWKGADDE